MGKRNGERGAAAVEYGLIVGLISILVILSAAQFGSSVLAMLTPVAALLQSVFP